MFGSNELHTSIFRGITWFQFGKSLFGEFMSRAQATILASSIEQDGRPGYDSNDDAKMYMSEQWFHDLGLRVGILFVLGA